MTYVLSFAIADEGARKQWKIYIHAMWKYVSRPCVTYRRFFATLYQKRANKNMAKKCCAENITKKR